MLLFSDFFLFLSFVSGFFLALFSLYTTFRSARFSSQF